MDITNIDLSKDHKSRKRDEYWSDLTQGNTGIYKEQVINFLLNKYLKTDCNSILDIGGGTSPISHRLKDNFSANKLIFGDYDEKLINFMKSRNTDPQIEWKVLDIFEIEKITDKFDLVLLLDMLHEVYSFYGREIKIDIINHQKGQAFINKALKNIPDLVNTGGAVCITDNILSDENNLINVRIRNDKVKVAVEYFLRNYTPREIQVNFIDEMTFNIKSHDFCILLTQYNKIKNQDWPRWNVEKMEIHQYMTQAEYDKVFNQLGFKMYSIIDTPEENQKEWLEDFEVLNGTLPKKRITLLAIKEI